MKKSEFKPSTLTIILYVALFSLVLLSAGGFYFTQNYLRDLVTSSTQQTATTATDANSPEALQQIRDEISKNQTYGDKASKLVAPAATWQNDIKTDIDKYATINNISISNYNYTPSISPEPVIDGTTPNYVEVSLNNPVPLTNFLQFLKSIESNLPKMKLAGIKIAPVAGSKDKIKVEPLIIEVYVK